MMNEQEHIDKLFSEKLADFSRPPSEKVWLGVEKNLQQNGKKRTILFIQRIAASIILLATLGGIYFFSTSNDRLKTSPGISNNPDMNKNVQQEDNSPARQMETSLPAKNNQKNSSKTDNIAKSSVSGNNKNTFSTLHAITPSTEVTPVVRIEDNFTETGKIYPLKSKTFFVTLGSEQVKRLTTTSQRGYTPSEASIMAMNVEMNAVNQPLKEKWLIGGQFSPTYSYRTVVNSEESASNSTSYYNNIEKPIIAYSGGVNVTYHSNDRLSIQSGIYYSKMGQAIKNITLYSPLGNSAQKNNLIAISNSLGAINSKSSSYDINNQDVESVYSPDNPFTNGQLQDSYSLQEEVTFQQNLEYIEIPFILKYKLWDSKVDFHLMGGLSSNFLVGNSVYLKADGEKSNVGETSGLKTFNYSGILGFGVDYNFASRFSLSVEPAFKYYLNPVNENNSLGYHPYSLGVYTGINYSF